MNQKLTNISALQLFQLVRFGAFVLIGIVFTKTQLSTQAIGEYEQFLFLAAGISFFWLNGLVRGILPLTKHGETANINRFFNAFVLLGFFSLVCVALLAMLARPVSEMLLNTGRIDYLWLLLLYLFLSVPANLVEYFFLIKNEPKKIIWYGIVSFFVTVLLVVVPAVMGKGIAFSLYGLVVSAALRYLYLWFLILKSGASLRLSFPYMKEHLALSAPLILSAVLSGSAQYVDGFIVTSRFDEATFAVFRYGARELPLAFLLANSFSNAMLPEFNSGNKIEAILSKLKSESARLANLLFPLSVVLLLLSHVLFPVLFDARFEQSASIFNIYLLLVTSRLLFPQTLLVGLKQTSVIAFASFLELILNVSLSLWFVGLWGIEGIAYATVLAYLFEKVFLVAITKKRLNIPVTKYQDISRHLIYSLLLFAVFYLVEFVIY
jgi:O-antigen/teichoic acid export membrane protein